MEVIYKNFDKEHIPDNEAHYFNLLESVIASVDQYSTFVITKNPASYMFRLSTTQTVVDPLVTQINSLNSFLGLQADFSKSMKSGNIFWKVQL